MSRQAVDRNGGGDGKQPTAANCITTINNSNTQLHERGCALERGVKERALGRNHRSDSYSLRRKNIRVKVRDTVLK